MFPQASTRAKTSFFSWFLGLFTPQTLTQLVKVRYQFKPWLNIDIWQRVRTVLTTHSYQNPLRPAGVWTGPNSSWINPRNQRICPTLTVKTLEEFTRWEIQTENHLFRASFRTLKHDSQYLSDSSAPYLENKATLKYVRI